MNCDECKKLIGPFMDCELDESLATPVRLHLSVCDNCARCCEELSSILDACISEPPSEVVPNPKAMWCRINNVLENEVKRSPAPEPRRFWQLSFGQLSAAFVCIAVLSSVLTAFLLKHNVPTAPPEVAAHTAEQTMVQRLLGTVGLVETPQQERERRMQQQKAAIEYWNERVQARRSQWDRATREAFDRNMKVIDESVNNYTLILQKDPDDELSGEMLDSVLSDKMNLLRDFSDL